MGSPSENNAMATLGSAGRCMGGLCVDCLSI